MPFSRGGGVDSHDPQRPKLAFALPAVAVCILAGAGDRLLGDFDGATARAAIALGGFEGFFCGGRGRRTLRFTRGMMVSC